MQYHLGVRQRIPKVFCLHKIRRIPLLVLITGLATPLGYSLQSKQAPSSSQSGYVQLSDNSYHNDLLGFRMRLPIGWVISTDIAGTRNGSPMLSIQGKPASEGNTANLATAASMQSSAVYLVRATPAGSGQAPATIYVMSEDLAHLPEIKSPLSYLVRMNNAMAQQNIKFMGVTSGILYNGTHTYRAFYGQSKGGTTETIAYYSMDVVMTRNHAVVFVISAKDTSTIEEIKPLLDGVSFDTEKSAETTPVPAPEVAKPPVVEAPVKSEKAPTPTSQTKPAQTQEHPPEKPEQTATELPPRKETQPVPTPQTPPEVATPTVAPTDVPERITMPEKAMEGYLMSKVAPEYPEVVTGGQRIAAVVVLKIVIGKDGKVKSLQLLSGHNDFVIEAMEAVREWRYKPFTVKSVPVEVDTQVTVLFKP